MIRLPVRGVIVPFFVLVGIALGACQEKDEIQVFVHGLPAQHIRVEQEALGQLTPQAWQALQAREDFDGIDTGGVDCARQRCRGVLVTLFIENPTASPWAPPLVRIRRGSAPHQGLPIAFSGYEISPNRRGRLRVLLHHPERSPPLSMHLSHSVSLDIQVPADGAPSNRK